MKSIALFAIIFASLNVFAGPNDRSLSITSFVYIENGNNRNLGAELCGTVSGRAHAMDRITVVSDYNTQNPGSYTTMLDNNGNFCVVLRTNSGQASARYWQFGATNASELTATATIQAK